MRSLALALLLGVLCVAPAQAKTYEQAELDALLAPIALYPDELVNHILVAAAYPAQVSDAARGAPPQPHWHPSVAALVPYPEILERMAESPHWMSQLSEAFIDQQASVMQTIHGLRTRAQAYGYVEPQREVVYVRYYDPLVVYGGWWWHSHRPHFWRPWHSHRVFIRPGNHHHHGHGDVHRKHTVLPAPRHVHTPPRLVHTPPRHVHSQPRDHSRHVKTPVRTFESQRQPIVSSTPQVFNRGWRSPSHVEHRGGRHADGGSRHRKQRR